MTKTLAIASALVLALTACSSSPTKNFSADEKKAAAALSESFQSQQNPASGFTADQGQADCIADSLVAEIGTDSLVQYGFLTEELEVDTAASRTAIPADDAGTMADIFMGCADLPELIKKDLNFDQMSEATQTCVDEALSDDTVRSVLVASFTGDSSVAQDLQTTLTACTLAG